MDLLAELKQIFVEGVHRMAAEDAADVKAILVAGNFVELDQNGLIVSCLLPQHSVLALGLLARVRRWEELNFFGHIQAGIPSAEDLLRFIGEHLCDEQPTPELESWGIMQLQVFRTSCVWDQDVELMTDVHDDDSFFDAIADFLLAAQTH